MNANWKSGIAALVGLAAVAWLGLDRVGSAGMLQTANDPSDRKRSVDRMQCS
jgi:hypothetical protein